MGVAAHDMGTSLTLKLRQTQYFKGHKVAVIFIDALDTTLYMHKIIIAQIPIYTCL